MKKCAVFLGLMGALILNVSWMLQGCNGRIPTLGLVVATSTPTLGPQWVDNFEGSSTSVNPYLYNSNAGLWSSLPSGVFTAPGGANGTAQSGHIGAGPLFLSGYTPYQLQANPNSLGNYNLNGGPYTGIQFYWKTGLADNMSARWFVCPIPEQIPPPVGNCGTGTLCYDTFKKPLAGTSDSWILMSFTWATFFQTGWGSPSTGSLTSSYMGSPNLSRILYFQWEEDPNNIGNNYTIDFYVDEIQLF